MNESQLNAGLAANHAAVDELIACVGTISADRWTLRPSAKKWSPAQHVVHIGLAYRAFVREARDGHVLQLIGTPTQRRMWRLLGLGQVLVLHRMPRGAPAPREIRPPESSPQRRIAVIDLRESVTEFESAFRETWRDRPGHRLLHPYFGAISLRQALRLGEVHTRHHTALIESLLTA